MLSHAPSAPGSAFDWQAGLSRVARAVRFWVLSDYGRYAFGGVRTNPFTFSRTEHRARL